MTDDFDENTLETMVINADTNEVIEPIKSMRENKKTRQLNDMLNDYFKEQNNINAKEYLEYQTYFKRMNIFVISREMFDKTADEMIEAWFTKFDQVFIDDTKKPYIPLYTKKEVAIHIAKKFNKTNLDKGLDMIHKTTDQISKFANSLDFDTSGSNRKRGKVKL